MTFLKNDINSLVLFLFQTVAMYENRIESDGSNIQDRKKNFKKYINKKIENKTDYLKKMEKQSAKEDKSEGEEGEVANLAAIATNDNEEGNKKKKTSELTEME